MFRKVIFVSIVSMIVFSGCGRDYRSTVQTGLADSQEPTNVGPTGATGANGTSCSTVAVVGGVDLICGSNAPVFLSNGSNGVNGQNGQNGQNGLNGTSCTASVVTGGVNVTCGTNAPVFLANGATGATGATGASGKNGTNGTNGTNGVNGTSCSGIGVSGGVNIVCGTNPPVFLANGASGNGFNPGIQCDVYTVLTADENAPVNWFKMFSDGTEKFSTVLTNFDVPNESNTDTFQGFTAAEQALVGYTNFALDCSGYLTVPADGYYNFSLSSDDGSELVIDDNVLINMADLQAYSTGTVSNVGLYSGRHAFNLIYFQGPPTNIGLTLSWQGPANTGLGTMAVIPPTYFSH